MVDGVVERKNMHIAKITHAMLNENNLPNYLNTSNVNSWHDTQGEIHIQKTECFTSQSV